MNQPQQATDDILNSIRNGVEEAQKASADSDVLELSPENIVEPNGTNGTPNGHTAAAETADDFIDINAFASSGSEKKATSVPASGDILGADDPLPQPASAPAEAAPVGDEKAKADAEFDKLLAELGADDTKEAPAPAAPAPTASESAAPEPIPETPPEAASPPPEPMPAAAPPMPASPPAAAASIPTGTLELAAISTTEGLQVAFPAEVLAAALRPMVKDWVAANLPQIVERLVKEEIAKLGQ